MSIIEGWVGERGKGNHPPSIPKLKFGGKRWPVHSYCSPVRSHPSKLPQEHVLFDSHPEAQNLRFARHGIEEELNIATEETRSEAKTLGHGREA